MVADKGIAPEVLVGQTEHGNQRHQKVCIGEKDGPEPLPALPTEEQENAAGRRHRKEGYDLRKVDVPSSYQVAPIPGVQFFHFTPGEGCSFVEAGIVKLSKGSRFPRHRHLGQEINFVLEGALIDNGISYGPGETVRNETGSEHDYLASEKRDLILVAGHNGITYLEG